MNITYQRTVRQSFMVIAADQTIPEYQMDMCSRNRMEHFLEFGQADENGVVTYWYDITGKQTLEEHLKGNKLNDRMLMCFLSALKWCTEDIERFLLEETFLALAPELIYVNAAEEKIYFCYGICTGQTLDGQLRSFMEYVLAKLDHSEKRAVDLAYQIYQKTLEVNFALDSVWDIFEQKASSKEADIHVWEEAKKTKDPEPVKEREAILEEPRNMTFWERAGVLLREQKERLFQKIGKLPSFGRSVHKSEYQMVFEPEDAKKEMSGETVFLGEQQEVQGVGIFRFLGDERGRDIFLDIGSATIGSGADADIQIPVQSVSRIHARVFRQEGSCFLEDVNSRNGTWVNGKLLNYKEEVEIFPEDIIGFAGERYRFCLS